MFFFDLNDLNLQDVASVEFVTESTRALARASDEVGSNTTIARGC